MDETRLIERLRLIEALFAGATTKGEKVAAEKARQRILERLQELENEDPPIEYSFKTTDIWSRKVFMALLRRYGIRPYRYKGQRYTTVMARVSGKFVDETLWPEFQEFNKTLRVYLSEVTDRVVSEVIHKDISEADVVEDPKALPPAGRIDPETDVSPSDMDRPTQNDAPAPADNDSESTGERSKRKGKKRRKRKRR